MIFFHCVLIYLAWITLAINCYGWGCLTSHCFKLFVPNDEKYFYNILIGFVFSTFLSALIHLFLPINSIISVIWLSLGSYFAFKCGFKDLIISFCSAIKSPTVIIFSMFVAFLAVQFPYCYDTGFYHLNAVKWINEYRIVPGLGNLHFRLGFNQIFFNWAALLNFHPFLSEYALHVANSFIVFIVGLKFLISKTMFTRFMFCMFAFMPCPLFWISTHSPDVALVFINLSIFYYIYKYLNCSNENNLLFYSAIIIVLSVFSITVKLSSIVFATGLIIFIVYNHYSNKRSLKGLKYVGIFSILMLFTWLLRGYINTGYPLFPSKFAKISFDWAVPEYINDYVLNIIAVFAKLGIYKPDSSLLLNYQWIHQWFNRIIYDVNGSGIEGFMSVVITGLSLTLFFIWLILSFCFKHKINKNFLFLWVICFISVAFWFIQAPDIRFTNGLFIVFFISSFFMINDVYKISLSYSKKRIVRIILYIIPLLNIFYVVNINLGEIYNFNGIAELPILEMKKIYITNDVVIYMPKVGTNVWNYELPSTPYLVNGLEMRGKTLQNGFRIKRK